MQICIPYIRNTKEYFQKKMKIKMKKSSFEFLKKPKVPDALLVAPEVRIFYFNKN